MALYIEVLRRRFPERQFTIWANDPGNMVAVDGGPLPSRAELDALMPEVDAEIEAELHTTRQQERFLNANPDVLLLAFEIVVEALADVRGKLRPAALTEALDDTVRQSLAGAAQPAERRA